MTMQLRTLAAAAGLAALLAAPPAAAFSAAQEGEGDPPPGDSARDLALESIQKLMQAMELLIDSIPQYEAPEINDDGDIIIRRKRDEEPDPDGAGKPDQEET